MNLGIIWRPFCVSGVGKVSKVMAGENAVFITPVTSCELLRCDILTAVKIKFTIFGYGIM
jgi:hypothetical protein